MKRFYCTNCGSEIFVGSKNPRETLKRPYNDYCSMCNSRNQKRVPDFETPEQYQERTGEPWPDNWAVYASTAYFGWVPMSYKTAKTKSHYDDGGYGFVDAIICATEAGPPPDGWKPEET